MSEHAIDIRQMPASEIGRLAEIDRTEQIRLMYKMIDGKLIAQAVDIQADQFISSDMNHLLNHDLAPELAEGGTLFGAFDSHGYPFNAGQSEYDHHYSKCPEGRVPRASGCGGLKPLCYRVSRLTWIPIVTNSLERSCTSSQRIMPAGVHAVK